jgi:hypothetical protein
MTDTLAPDPSIGFGHLFWYTMVEQICEGGARLIRRASFQGMELPPEDEI